MHLHGMHMTVIAKDGWNTPAPWKCDTLNVAPGERYDVIDPTTGEVYATAPMSSAEDVVRAYVAAAEAFESWGDTTPKDRATALLKIADAIEARVDEINALAVRIEKGIVA